MERSSKDSSRLLELDALRGIACLSVILYHYTFYYEKAWGHSSQPLILFEQGRYGVQLFFLLSGFVIFMSLKQKNIKKFLWLRFWRLFPGYLMATVVIFFISKFISLSPEILVHGEVTFFELLINLTMLPNLFSLRYVDSTYWTLGFEILFYINLAIIFSLTRGNPKIIIYILLFWTTISILWYQALKSLDIYTWMTVWWHQDMSKWQWQHSMSKLFLFPYIHLFLIGIAFYLIYQNKATKLAIFCIFWGLIANYFVWGAQDCFFVIIVVFIFQLGVFFKPTLLRNKLLLYLGTISYSLYLVHQNIGYLIIQKTENLGLNSNLSIMISILAVIIIANPLYFYIEKPFYQKFKGYLLTTK